MMHDSVVTAINNALQAHQITAAEANNALRELERLFKFDGKISLTEYLISVHWLGPVLADILRDNESLMRWINQNLPGLRDLLNSLPENIRNQVLEYLLEGLSQFFGEDSDCVLFAIITYESSRRNCNKLLTDNDLKDICRQVLDCNDRPAGPTLEELMGEVSPGGGAGGAGMSRSN